MKLPFELSRFYLTCKMKARTYFKEFLIIYITGTLASWSQWMLWNHCEMDSPVKDSNGYTTDLYMYG